jgi:PAS domain S-box-containing protein
VKAKADLQQALAALRSSEERTRLIIDNALDAVITMDFAGRIVGWNAHAETIFGWSREEAMGSLLADTIVPPRFRDAHRTGLQRYLDTGEGPVLNRRIEIFALHRDGREFPVELAITPIRGGESLLFSAFVRDITERTRGAEALRRSEERFRTLAESLPHLVWTCRSDGWCDYLSRQWVEYTGRPESEQLGSGWAEQLHPQDRARVQAEWAEAAARGDRFDIEFRIRRADGVYRWFKTRAVPIRDDAGSIVKWFGSNTDFDDFKRSEAHLRAQLERMRLLDRITRAIGERQDLHSIFQAVLRSLETHMPIDFGCVCLYEPGGRELRIASLGPSSVPMIGTLDMPEQSRIEIDASGLSRSIAGQLVYEPDISASRFPFIQRLARAGLGAVVIAPLIVESRVFGLLVAARRGADAFTSGDCEFLRQLSEHVALAAHQADLYVDLQTAYDHLQASQQTVMQQERLRVLGQMASGIAHDINNALSPAALYIQSLLEREASLSEGARSQLTVVERAIEDVAKTVARMREFYRRSEPNLTHAAVDVNRLLEQVVDLTRARWHDMPQERGSVIQLRMELADSLPQISGAEGEIRDAVANLILNAIDAMPEGGVLTVRSRALVTDGADKGAGTHLVVEVADTGAGMSEETRSRCLEPFFTTKGERGTGLGLAMVYGMLQRHGGRIEIDSVPGAGTTMRLVFPLRLRAPAEAPAAASQMGETRRPSRPLRILLVDDDPLILSSLEDTLRADGHAVTVAEGGAAGIEAYHAAAARGERFAAVITDLGMPHVDGRKVAANIKSAALPAPVILLTGWGQRILAEDSKPPGVDRVLSKPPRVSELRGALAELTSGSLEA